MGRISQILLFYSIMPQLLAEYDLVFRTEQEEDILQGWSPSSKNVLSSQS